MYIFLKDAKGRIGYRTSVSMQWASGEQANLRRTFDGIRTKDPRYEHVALDPETVEYVEERDSFGDGPETPFVLTAKEASRIDTMTPDEILAELGLID